MPSTKKENPHAGHRKRMRAQALKNGLDFFNDHQMLELLLFYGIPQRDTNCIAHELIDNFGSLANVFDANEADLKSIKYMTSDASTLIKLMPQFAEALLTRRKMQSSIKSADTFTGFFMAQFYDITDERVFLTCLDDQLHIIEIIQLDVNKMTDITTQLRTIISHAIRTNASQIAVSYNHRRKDVFPTPEERAVAEWLRKACYNIKLSLAEVVLVGEHGIACLGSCQHSRLFGHSLEERDRFLSEWDESSKI